MCVVVLRVCMSVHYVHACMSVHHVHACMSVHHVHACSALEPGELQLQMAELPCECWKLNPGLCKAAGAPNC